ITLKAPFSTTDLEAWKTVVSGYRADPAKVAKRSQFVVKQHNPDWNDIQLLLDCLMESKRVLVLKAGEDAARDKTPQGEDVKEHFLLQDPWWDPNKTAEQEKLREYQEWIRLEFERGMPKTINWSDLYSVRQGITETPSEFLD
ncbi:hypothetical protein N330_13729, partial [Leptosomus discolor]